MTLETKRLVLRISSQEEMVDMIKREADPALKCAYQEMLKGCLAHPNHWVWHAIWRIEAKDGGLLGDLSFKGPAVDGAVEIGYGMLEVHRGKGYATEAVKAAVEWALAQPGVTRVEAETDPANRASQNVLIKCGFRPTGVIGDEGPRFVRQDVDA